MIPSRKLFLFCIVFFCFSACGIDKLNHPTTTTTQQQQNKECSFTSTGPPVCGNDGKDYLNKEHAECFTTVKHIGHCQCSTTLLVCGSDGADHNECEAIASLSYSIIKFVGCAVPEL